MSPTPPGAPRSDDATRTVSATIRSMQVGQHVITGVLLLVGAVRALTDGAPLVLVLVVSLLFAGWYVGGIVLAGRTDDRMLASWWLIGLALIWAAAVVASVEFIWLAFSLWLLAGYLLRWRWAVLFSALVFVAVVGAPFAHLGTTTYASLIGPLVGGIFALGISRGYVQLVHDARERQRLVASLVQAQNEMADLHEELARVGHEAGASHERTRLSRDLHDTIAQDLASISLLARGALEHEADAARRRTLQQIETLSAEGLDDARRIVAALAPAELEESALAGALRRMLDRLAEESGLATELYVDDELPILPTTVEVALLRTAQSALANVRLHAGAHRVVVSLTDADESVRLDFVDDGAGFDASGWDDHAGPTPLGGYGLHSMRARLRELGGGLDVESNVGDGTALSAHVPIIRAAEGA